MNWITAKANNKVGELMIYGDITDYKWSETDVVPKEVDEEIKKLKDCSEIIVRVNSYGGSVFAGLAIVSMIKKIRAKTTAIIEGIGASMGSVIPLACDKVKMAENAMMMIHKPSSMTWGTADDMRKEADVLDKCEKQLIDIYMKRYKGSETDLKEKLAQETWFNATEALEYGLIDEIDEAVDVAASANGLIFNKLKIDKENPIYKQLKVKGEFAKLDIFSKIKEQFGVEIKKDETLENALKSISEAYKEPKAIDIKVIENEDGSKSVMNGDVELAKVEAKVIEKTITVDKTDTEIKAKAEEFDKLKKSEIENALKNGIKAKGEAFDNDRWSKILNGFSIAEIKAQSNEWFEDAKKTFNAGKRFTENDNVEEVKISNIDDFKLN